jgi:hypothetical protein
MFDPRWLILLAALPACSAGGRREDPAGRAAQRLAFGDTIGNVVVDPGTYHFADPSLVLATAEGAGPRTLNISVESSVIPHISYTGTRTPSHSDLSAALGYDVALQITLIADSAVLVPIDAYYRCDAYPSYQKATYTVFGFGQTVQGTGVAYKPIGIYFDTCGCIGPDPCGAACSTGFPDGDTSSPSDRDGG